jgi:hypothetical protein
LLRHHLSGRTGKSRVGRVSYHMGRLTKKIIRLSIFDFSTSLPKRTCRCGAGRPGTLLLSLSSVLLRCTPVSLERRRPSTIKGHDPWSCILLRHHLSGRAGKSCGTGLLASTMSTSWIAKSKQRAQMIDSIFRPLTDINLRNDFNTYKKSW